jgi:type IV fimbrial biogenesis protein FimT
VLNAFPIAKPLGFSLIEMMIVLVIIALATTMGIPSYRQWVMNTQIRNAAQSVQNGMQKARAESVKRNASIEFVLGTSPLWTIQTAGGGAEIERGNAEGTKNVTYTVTPVGATTVTFNSLGTVGVPPNQPLNTDGSAPFTKIDFDSSALSAADSRNLSVTIGAAGNIKMCDPDPGLATTDPRKC